MAIKPILRLSLLAAVAVALLGVAAPAQAGWGVRVGWSAAVVAPPLVFSVGSAPVYRPYARPYYPGYVVPYAAPCPRAVVVAPVPAVSFVRVWAPYPYPHWAVRRVVAPVHRYRRY